MAGPRRHCRERGIQLAVRIYSLAKELKLDSKGPGGPLHEGGRHGQGLGASQPDRRRSREGQGVCRRWFAAGNARGPAPVQQPAVAVAAEPTPLPARRLHRAGRRGAGKPPLLTPKPLVAKADKPADAPKRPLESRIAVQGRPAIRVAPLPSVQQPTAPGKPAEPEPQKPDIKLPADAIRAGACRCQSAAGPSEEARGQAQG